MRVERTELAAVKGSDVPKQMTPAAAAELVAALGWEPRHGDSPGSRDAIAEFRAAAHALAVRIREDRGAGPRPEGRVREVSVSMPEDLRTAVEKRVGPGEFSTYVTEAVTRQLELDLLGDLSVILEEKYGPVSEEALAKASAAWLDAE